jgi:hypothetical protein
MSIGCNYDNPWIYEEKIFDSDQIQDYYGFVYLIRNTLNHRSYIGRKYLWQFRTPKGKNRKVKSESDWKKYYGSCPELKEDIQKFGKENFTRNILSLHRTKEKQISKKHDNSLFTSPFTNLLTIGTPAYYNSNILSRYFRKDYYGNTD